MIDIEMPKNHKRYSMRLLNKLHEVKNSIYVSEIDPSLKKYIFYILRRDFRNQLSLSKFTDSEKNYMDDKIKKYLGN